MHVVRRMRPLHAQWKLKEQNPVYMSRGYFRSVRAPSYQDYLWIFLGYEINKTKPNPNPNQTEPQP